MPSKSDVEVIDGFLDVGSYMLHATCYMYMLHATCCLVSEMERKRGNQVFVQVAKKNFDLTQLLY